MPLDKPSLRTHLAETRGQLIALVARLRPDQWEIRVQGDDGLWTARESLIHLVVSEPGQLATLKGIAEGGSGIGSDFDVHRWNIRQVEKLQASTVDQLVAALAASRVDVLAALDALTDEQLELLGHHARGDELSVAGMFYRIGEHEMDHLAVIEAAVG